MDAELSRRLAWYLNYDLATRELTDAASRQKQEDDKKEFISAAEEAVVFDELPSYIQAKIMSAELEWTIEEFPFVPQPWPLRDK
jgi:hypothetical protein